MEHAWNVQLVRDFQKPPKTAYAAEISISRSVDLALTELTLYSYRFSGFKDAAGYSYNYNPCMPFNDGNKCQTIFVSTIQLYM